MFKDGKTAVLGDVILRGDQPAEPCADVANGEFRQFVVQTIKGGNITHMFGSDESAQQRFAVDTLSGEPVGVGGDKRFFGGRRYQYPLFQRLSQGGKTCRACLLSHSTPVTPSLELFLLTLDRGRCGAQSGHSERRFAARHRQTSE